MDRKKIKKLIKRVYSLDRQTVVIILSVVVGMFLGLFGIQLYLKYLQTQPLPLRTTNKTTGYLYEASSKDITIRIADQKTNEPKVELSTGKSRLSFMMSDIKSSQPAPQKMGDQVTFANVQPETDLSYKTLPNGIKEELTIRQATGKNTFFFHFQAQDAYPKSIMKGFYFPIFYNSQGAYLFHMLQPFAIDAKGNRTDTVHAELTSDGTNGAYLLKLTVDEKWLTDPSRAYPITIDPTVVHNTTTLFANGIYNHVVDTGSGASPNLTTNYQELPTDINTVGLWHMNETTDNTCSGGVNDICDVSGNGNDLPSTNTTITTTAQKLGAAARTFNGTSAYFRKTSVTTFQRTTGQALTVEAWVNPSRLGGQYQGIVGNRTSGTLNWYLYQHTNDGSIQLHGSTQNKSTYIPPTNKWTHIAATVDAGGTYNLYADGQLVQTVTGYTYGGTVDEFTIGSWSGSSEYFQGSIDEVRISNIARTPEEIKADASRRRYGVYTSPVMDLGGVTGWNSLSWIEGGANTGDGETVASASGLVAQWNFNETSGTTADNAQGTAALDGTLAAGFASTTSQDSAAGTGWTANNRRWGAGALMFDGSNDYITITDNASLKPTSAISIEAWIRLNSLPTGAGTIFDHESTTPYYGYYFNVNTSGKISSDLYTSASTTVTGNTILTLGQWHHVVTTYDGATQSVYVDGQLDGSVAKSGAITYTATVNPSIGARYTGAANFFPGTIDSTRIYSRALTASEILSSYQAGNVELQTRVGASTDANDGTWEAWKPTTGETAIAAMDADNLNWRLDPFKGQTPNASSCKEILDRGQSTGDGIYSIELAGQSTQVYCDMTTDSGGWTLVANIAPADGNSVGYNNQAFWTTQAEYGSFANKFSNDYKSPAAYTLNGNQLMIQSTNTGSAGSILGWRRWPMLNKRTFSSFFTTGIVAVHATDYCETENADSISLGTTNTWDDIIRRGTCLYSDINPSSSGEGDTIRLTTIPGNSTDNLMSGFASCIDCAATWQGASIYMGIDRAGCNNTSCAYNSICRVPSADCLGSYCTNPTYATTSCGSTWNSRFYIREKNTSTVSITNDSTTKIEGTGSLKATLGAPQVDTNTVALWHLDEIGGTGAYLKDNGPGTASPFATGGTITYSGGNTIHTFTTGGTFTANAAGNVDVLVVGGGGGGSGGVYAVNYGGGGGGGTVKTSNAMSLTAQAYTVGVGTAGGGTIQSNAGNGGSSSFNGLVATGGNGHANASRTGGSNADYAGGTDGSGTNAGAGAGAGANGSGITGGTGVLSSLSGSSVCYGGGGGGNQGGSSGGCGGGNGTTGGGVSATANTGGGGGGGNSGVAGGNGGTGIVIIRYPTSQTGGITHNDGTPTGTSVVNGFANKARSFNGSSDVITRASVTTYNTSRTVEFWFNPATTGAQRGIISVGNVYNDTGPQWLIVQTSGNLLSVYHGANYRNGTTVLAVNQWYHCAYTFNSSSNAVALYLNGNLEYSGTVADYNGSNTNLYIGAGYNAYFSGKLDEIRISNTARTHEEIAEAYRAGRDHYINRTISSTDLSGKTSLPFYVASDRQGTFLNATIGESAFANYQPDANTVGLWHLDEQSGSGAYFKDSSGNGKNGTPTGTTYTQGKIGKARSFNNTTGDYINPNLGSNIANNYTVSAWVFLTSDTPPSGNQPALISQTSCNASNTTEIFLGQGSGANPTSINIGRCNSYTGGSSTGTYSLNQWTHIAVTVSSTKLVTYYINGKNAGTYDASALDTTIVAADAKVGGYRPIGGTIDELRISNIARTADQIRQAYEVGLRTHSITIDFRAALNSGNLIANTSDLSFTIDSTAFGGSSMGSNLYLGDKIIVKENYNGTEYIAQGTVNAVNTSTGAVTVAAWDSGSTVPSGGFTVNATVFKWQREYFDLRGSLSTQRDAVTNLTLRLTSGSEGRTVWLDDLRSSSGYLTTPAGSSIGSSIGNQYFQYRIIELSNDESVSAAVSSITVDYSQYAPATPTIGSPSQVAATSIRWNYADNSNNEDGFKLYDDSNTLLTSSGANTTYIDEIGLTPNTQYTRKVAAYRTYLGTLYQSSYSGTATTYTLANVPTAPTVVRSGASATVNPNPNGNSAATLFAIYKEPGTVCDGTGGVYVAANGSDNGATAVWQTDSAWSTVTSSGLSTELNYSFCVKAINGNSIETAFGASQTDNNGVFPLSGNVVLTRTSTCVNIYQDITNPSRYICGVDAGSGQNNTATLELKSGSMTVLSNQTLAVGRLLLTGGSLKISSGGAVMKVRSHIWVSDIDGDHYSTRSAALIAATAPNSTYKLMNTMSTLLTFDCNDNDATKTTVCCAANGTSCSSDGTCCSAVCATNADGDGYFSSALGHSGTCQATVLPYTDCNDGSSLVYTAHTQCYTDNDGDGYTVGLAANTTCLNSSSCDSATYASASTNGATVTAYAANHLRNSATTADCNDNDANYHPGNGGWYSSSNDYNCSGGIEKLYPEWWCNTCHSGTGRQADIDGIAAGTACGASGTWWRTLGYGCWYPSSICPAQTNSSVTQQCH